MSEIKTIIQKNTSAIWDNVWKREKDKSENIYLLKQTSNNILTRKIISILLKKYGSIKGLKTIEIGAGTGKISGVLAKKGAEVTILDYSENAINSSKKFFEDNNLKANFILNDAFNIKDELNSNFDISMSFGTAEHFTGNRRKEIIKIHFDVLKENGVTFIQTPNKHNLPYITHKFLSERFNRWLFGEEYPFSGYELKKLSKNYCKKQYVIGGYLFQGSFMLFRRVRNKLNNKLKVKKEFSTPFDHLFSKSICLVGEK
jgi:2-polyprenyl-3-methyl-5-hydroxy-6-metoxy-1,4-benzoquinol methylase